MLAVCCLDWASFEASQLRCFIQLLNAFKMYKLKLTIANIRAFREPIGILIDVVNTLDLLSVPQRVPQQCLAVDNCLTPAEHTEYLGVVWHGLSMQQ